MRGSKASLSRVSRRTVDLGLAAFRRRGVELCLRFVLGAVLWLTPLLAQAEPLTLPVVLRSVETTHPDLLAARAGVEEARGGLLAARGAFDLKVYAEGSHSPVGKYDKSYGAVGLSQPTTVSGLELYARYENGAGFAPYDGARVTSEVGRASLGLILPLLRDRSIDENRLGRLVNDFQVAIAEEQLRQARASTLAAAAATFWKWVVTGQKLRAHEELVLQAEQRKLFLEEQVKSGAIPRVELVDNLRLVAGRRAKLSAVKLEFRQLCLALGLYRRTDEGLPLAARADELPELPEVQSFDSLPRAKLKEALLKAPGLRIYENAGKIVEKELAWAKNQTLPELDLELFTSQSYGATRPYSELDRSVTETAAGGKLKLSWDVQRRKARGKTAQLRAKLQAIEAKNRQLADKLGAEFEGQLASLDAQFEIADLSREATRQAREVSAAERESFNMGQSSLLALNLREQAAISAYLEELDAVLEFQRSWVKLQEILGADQMSAFLPPQGGRVEEGAEP